MRTTGREDFVHMFIGEGKYRGSLTVGGLRTLAGLVLIQPESAQKRKNDFTCSSFLRADRFLFGHELRNDRNSSVPKLDMKTRPC